MIYNAEYWGQADLFTMIAAAWIGAPLLVSAFFVFRTVITEAPLPPTLDQAAPVLFGFWFGTTLLVVGLLLLGAASCRIVGVCI